jgi:vitamin K-dependent gamma-carboxylase-like protein
LIRRIFEVKLDLRALAGLRIGLGFLVLLDLAGRLRDLEAFYTDGGVLPRTVLLQMQHPTLFNFLLTVGTSVGVLVWFLLLALSATGLMLGWHTRLCTCLTWVLHIALKHRNPLILDIGDLQLGLILFWGIFLPLGARYSFDARANSNWRALPNSYSSLATTGYLLQISLIYLMAGLHKLDPVWTDSGLALYYVLNQDQFATTLGHALSQQISWLRPASFLVVFVELLIPLLLWFPWRRRQTRGLACFLILTTHLTIASLLHIGLIPLISVVITFGLWSGWLFEAVAKRFPTLPGIGKKMDSYPAYHLNSLSSGFLGLVCLYLVYLNYAEFRGLIVSKPIKYFGYSLRLQQTWQMFAPHPGKGDGWFVARAHTLGGEEIDILRDGAKIGFEKPESVAGSFPNQRWRAWFIHLFERGDPLTQEAFANWLARDWNEEHPGPQSVKRVELIYISEPTPLPEQKVVANPVVFFDYHCPESLYQNPGEVYLPLEI